MKLASEEIKLCSAACRPLMNDFRDLAKVRRISLPSCKSIFVVVSELLRLMHSDLSSFLDGSGKKFSTERFLLKSSR